MEQAKSPKATHLIREAAIILVGKILVLELLFLGIVLVARSIQGTTLYESLSLWIIIGAQTVHTILLIYFLLSWISRYYLLKSRHVVMKQGIIKVEKEFCSLSTLGTVHVEQGILGRIFRFGTIIISSPILEEHMEIIRIPSPQYYAKLIQKTMYANQGSSKEVEVLDRQGVKRVIPVES